MQRRGGREGAAGVTSRGVAGVRMKGAASPGARAAPYPVATVSHPGARRTQGWCRVRGHVLELGGGTKFAGSLVPLRPCGTKRPASVPERKVLLCPSGKGGSRAGSRARAHTARFPDFTPTCTARCAAAPPPGGVSWAGLRSPGGRAERSEVQPAGRGCSGRVLAFPVLPGDSPPGGAGAQTPRRGWGETEVSLLRLRVVPESPGHPRSSKAPGAGMFRCSQPPGAGRGEKFPKPHPLEPLAPTLS